MKRLIVLAGVIAGLAPVALAAPASADSAPYPDISHYAKLDFEGFKIADKPGVWFSTPTGLNCGIWDDGSFGCTGNIPGAPPGTNQIGWFSGDSSAHFDNTDQPRFNAGSPQRVLPANNYIAYNGTSCATTPDNSVYCNHSSYQRFLISPTNSWLGS